MSEVVERDVCRFGGCPFSRGEWEARLNQVQGSVESHQSIVLDRLEAIAVDTGRIVERLDQQNGRIGRLEVGVAEERARGEVRGRTVKVLAWVVVTLLTVVGLAQQWVLGR